MKKSNWLLLLLVIVLPIALFAQAKQDTVVTAKSFGIAGYPIVFYTPETSLAAGLGGMIYFRMSEKKIIRPSKVIVSAWYTVNDQYFMKIAPQIYFPGARRELLDLRFTYGKEIGKFYGIGNDTEDINEASYTMKSLRFYAEAGGLNIIASDIYFGAILDYSPNELVDKQANPYLKGDLVPGHDGGTVSGLGVLFIFDTRDHVFFPTKNFYHKFRLQYFGKYMGSEFKFNRLVSDMRYYTSPIPTHILAFQFYADITTGTPPFFRLPALGGEQRMRGYFTGRYRDRLYLTTQIEYRKIVWWRLGVAAFVAAGDVAHKWTNFSAKSIKYSYGFGLRFVFDKDEQINVRMDLGFGKNTSGIYFALEEAF